jgi:hypothetical protein
MAKKRKAPARRKASPDKQPSALVPLLVSGVVLLLGCFYLSPFLPDDAFISYRYAENLVRGHEFAFNPGEPLEAYSNFLWILVCAALFAMGMSLAEVTPLVGVALTLGGLVVLWRLSRGRVQHTTALYVPLLIYALSGPLILYTICGMETALFGFLLMVMILAADWIYRGEGRRGWVLLTGAGFLLSLTRPEGVVTLPLVLAWMMWELRGEGGVRRRALISAASFAVLYAAYTAWRVSYFGDWLPTPFWSKGYDAFALPWRKNFIQYFVQGHYHEAPSGYYFVALALIGVVAAVMTPREDDTRRTDRLALVTAAAMSLVYVNFVDWMPHMRYHVPLLGLLCVPLARITPLFAPAAWRAPLGFGAAVALAALILFNAFEMQRIRSVTMPMTLGREACLVPISDWLGRVLPRGSTIAIGDVGVVPYRSGLRTIDIHPESLTDRHIAREGLTVDYMLHVRPDAVLLNVRGVYSAKMAPTHYKLYHHRAFNAEYQFVGTVRQRWYLDRSYWVFVHKSVQVGESALRAFPTGIGSQMRVGFTLSDDGGEP